MVDFTIATENSAPNQLNDKIIDAVVKATMAAQGSMRSTPKPKVTATKSEAAVNAYQYSPQDPNVLYDKVSRLEQGMQQLLNVVGNRPQDTGPKIAAYQPITTQSADEELLRLREENRFLRTSQRGPKQPQQFQNRMNYDSRDAFKRE